MEKVTLKNKPGLPRLAALILLMVLSSFGTKAFAEVVQFTSGKVKYEVTDEENKYVKVIGNNNTYTGEVTISATVANGGTTYSVTAINGEAFYNCTGMTSISIPNSVANIGKNAFGSWFANSLAKVIVEDVAAWCKITFEDFTANPLGIAHHLYLSTDTENEVTDLKIPDGVTKIGDYVFYGCTGLTSVSIPSSVTNIGIYAFGNCDKKN